MQITHKGYTLIQAKSNCHYIIYDANGRMMMHVQYTEPLTEEKARECIENYILFTGIPQNIKDKLLESEESEDD